MVPLSMALVAHGVPIIARVPLTEVPLCVNCPVPVPDAPNAPDVAVIVQLPLRFAECELRPQPVMKHSERIQMRPTKVVLMPNTSFRIPDDLFAGESEEERLAVVMASCLSCFAQDRIKRGGAYCRTLTD
jgi:hypothetical protein